MISVDRTFHIDPTDLGESMLGMWRTLLATTIRDLAQAGLHPDDPLQIVSDVSVAMIEAGITQMRAAAAGAPISADELAAYQSEMKGVVADLVEAVFANFALSDALPDDPARIVTGGTC